MSQASPAPMALLNALTIDVEEYFHPNAMDDTVSPAKWESLPQRVERNTLRLLDRLDEHDVRATFFVLGWVAERWPRLVDEIAGRGHEIASHGYSHRLVYRQDPRQFRCDVARGKAVLEDRLGTAVHGFRAASYSIVESTMWALDVLIEEGFRYDSSIFPIRHDLYGIPSFQRFVSRIERSRGTIFEIPASTVRFLGRNWPVAGGGYFRLLPYEVTRRAVRHLNQHERQAAIVYVHPWEIDPEQPRLRAGARARFRQYTNLRVTESRLMRLLREFRFGPLREALPVLGLSTPDDERGQAKRAAAG